MSNKCRKKVKPDDGKLLDPETRKWIRQMERCFNYDTLFTTEEEREAYQDLKDLYVNFIGYLTIDGILKQKGMSKEAIDHTISTCYREEEMKVNNEGLFWDALEKLVQYGKVKQNSYPYMMHQFHLLLTRKAERKKVDQ